MKNSINIIDDNIQQSIKQILESKDDINEEDIVKNEENFPEFVTSFIEEDDNIQQKN